MEKVDYADNGGSSLPNAMQPIPSPDRRHIVYNHQGGKAAGQDTLIEIFSRDMKNNV
jgi:hypothetical protein